MFLEVETNADMPVEIFSGENCVTKNAWVFSRYGSKALIITGGRSAKASGALDDVLNALESCGISCVIYDKIGQNPETASCFEAAGVYASSGAEFIVGIGGGSPLDGAKAAAIYAASPFMTEPSDIYTKEHTEKPVPLLLVGTTAGTGSEVTGVSVLTDSSCGRKKSVHGRDCYALAAFCDYRYTLSAPESVVVSTALDAFAHATESLFATNADKTSEFHAYRALDNVAPFLRAIRDRGFGALSVWDRMEAYEGSVYAGLAINKTGTCFPHTLGYILTEDFGIPHGKACTAFTSEFLDSAEATDDEEKKAVFRSLTLPGDELRALIAELTGDLSNVRIPDVGLYVPRWQGRINSFLHTPGGFTAEDAARIFEKRFSV